MDIDKFSISVTDLALFFSHDYDEGSSKIYEVAFNKIMKQFGYQQELLTKNDIY